MRTAQGHLMSSLYALLKRCNQLVDRAESKKKHIYIYIHIIYYPHTCRGVVAVRESTVQFEQKGVIEALSE